MTRLCFSRCLYLFTEPEVMVMFGIIRILVVVSQYILLLNYSVKSFYYL
jgi:hypothetical protein